MKYSYIIIEDNKGALQNLKIELEKFPLFTNIGEAYSYNEGKRLIVEKRPSLIFLDVELDEKKGFDLVNEVKPMFHHFPKVIMTTGHVKYAKESTNNDYLYYLDKPIDYNELYLALEKFKKQHLQETRVLDIKKLDAFYFHSLDEIYYLQANGTKTYIIKTDFTKQEVSKTLKEIGDLLPKDFLRVHKSYIINTKFIEKLSLSEKAIYLNIKTGVIEFGECISETQYININKGKSFVFDESLRLKNLSQKIPFSDSYLDSIKDTLLLFNKN